MRTGVDMDMQALGRYRVTGRVPHRGHQPGEVFEARLDRRAEARAIARGSIELITLIPHDLVPGSYRLPTGPPTDATQERKG